MAVSLKNVGALNIQASTSSITPILPSLAAGDLLIALVYTLNATIPTITPPSGWTEIANATSGGLARGACYYKIAAGGDADPEFTLSELSPAHARVVSFEGVNPSSPIGATGAVGSGTGSSHSSTGITATGDGLIFYWDISRADTPLGEPSGWTEWFDTGGTNARSSGGSKVVSIGAGSGNISVLGAVSPWLQQQIEILAVTASGVGSSAGSSTAQAVSSSASGVGSAAGSATASGVSAAASVGAGSASGGSTAQAVGAATGGAVTLARPPGRPLIFTDAAALLLAGGSINPAVAVRLELPGETLNLALGQGSIVTNDGTRWEGLGDLGAIDGLDFGPLAATETITMTLSGLNADLARLAREDSSDIRGSRVSVYVLLFNEKLQPIDLPYLCQVAVLDRASLKRTGDVYALEMTAEPLFSSKHIPPLNLVTHSDQQERWPGDRIFERAAYPHSIFWTT